MADDINASLSEIAQLLRQRVEQSADMAKRAQERFERIPVVRERAIPDFAAIEAKHEAAATIHREEAAKLRAEDVAFRERLLKAIEDQNELLRDLIARRS